MADLQTRFLQRSLTLRHLRLLLALNELKKVSHVAEALHVSQPAISKALADIESGLGVALFERTPAGLIATSHGACLIRYAQLMTSEMERLGDELVDMDRGATSNVAVGAMPGSTSGLLPKAMLQARARLPELVVSVTEGPMAVLLRQLRKGALQLIVGALPERLPIADLEVAPLYMESLAIVCRPEHPLAAQRGITVQALLKYPWVLPPKSARVRDVLDISWRRGRLRAPPILAETVSLGLILSLVMQSDGLGVLTLQQAERFAAGSQVLILDTEPLGVKLPVGILTLRGALHTSAVTTLIEAMTDAVV